MEKSMFVMSKKDLADKAAEVTGLSKKQASETVNAVFDAIIETLKDGGEVSVSGFGKFEVAERAARQGVNPATGEKIEIAASKSVKFKAAKALKDAGLEHIPVISANLSGLENNPGFKITYKLAKKVIIGALYGD